MRKLYYQLCVLILIGSLNFTGNTLFAQSLDTIKKIEPAVSSDHQITGYFGLNLFPIIPYGWENERVTISRGFELGLSLHLPISKRLQLNVGLGYSARKIKKDFILIFHNLYTEFEALNLHLLEIPFSLQYNYFQKKNLVMFVSTGFKSNFLLAKSIVIKDTDSLVTKFSHAAIGFQYEPRTAFVCLGMQNPSWFLYKVEVGVNSYLITQIGNNGIIKPRLIFGDPFFTLRIAKRLNFAKK